MRLPVTPNKQETYHPGHQAARLHSCFRGIDCALFLEKVAVRLAVKFAVAAGLGAHLAG